jgi:hypothetical protein
VLPAGTVEDCDPPATAAQRQGHHDTRRFDARESPNALDGALVEHSGISRFVPHRAEVQASHYQPLQVDARVDGHGPLQGPQADAGPHEEDHGERNLHRDQGGRKSPPGRDSHRLRFIQRNDRSDTGRLDGWREAKEQPGDQRCEQGEPDDPEIDPRARRELWDLLDEPPHGHGESQPYSPSQEGEQSTFSEKLPDDSRLPRAQRTAHGELAATGHSSCQKQIRRVGAGDEEEHPRG